MNRGTTVSQFAKVETFTGINMINVGVFYADTCVNLNLTLQPKACSNGTQTWGQVLIIVLESSTSTFINPQVQVQVKVLSTYVKYKYFYTITSTSTIEIKSKKIK